MYWKDRIYKFIFTESGEKTRMIQTGVKFHQWLLWDQEAWVWGKTVYYNHNWKFHNNFDQFYRYFDENFINKCDYLDINEGTSEDLWRFSDQNITFGRLAEIQLFGWSGYHHDYYLINIITERNVFQAVHGLSIS